MNDNPLFQSSDSQPPDGADAAVRLIRSKVERAYQAEPDARAELAETKIVRTLSKHQKYMQELSASGKSLAEIQTAWHRYYTTLPDVEKHEVWQEFYAANQNTPYQKLFQKQHAVLSRKSETAERPAVAHSPADTVPTVTEAPAGIILSETPAADPLRRYLPDKDRARQLKQKIAGRVNAGGKLRIKHHVQSVLFGLATGFVVLLIMLFSFFNQYIIAPFIQPSRTVSATPIILGDETAANANQPQVIIPKINVQIPLDFSVQTNDENAIEDALQSGVVHYPSTVLPGQNGNTAFFGHSSNNIFNPGKYKFAFVLLHTLVTGDTFYLTSNGKIYAYRVFAREIVDPGQVSVLTDTKGKTATATLITCDPPGTSLHRLVVWGEQISPAVSSNTTSTAAPVSSSPAQLANNGPTLWSRLVNTVEFWN